MKRVLVIQDFAVVGKTDGVVSVSILAAMGIEAVFVPVNVFAARSTEVKTDLSCNLPQYADFFAENKIHFDGIFVNGDFSERQSSIIDDFIEKCAANDSFLVFSLINSCKKQFFLKGAFEKSNILILTLEHLASIYGIDFDDKFKDRGFVEDLVFKACRKFSCNVVVTDFVINDKKNGVILWEKNKGFGKWLYYNVFNCDFLGLSDIFSAIVAGAAVKKIALDKALALGIDFIGKAVNNTISEPAHNWYGADFEKIIWQLSDSLP